MMRCGNKDRSVVVSCGCSFLLMVCTHDQYLRLQTCPCISSSRLHTLIVEATRSQQQGLRVEARGKISKVRAKVSWQHCMHYHTKTECMVRTHHYLDWDLATESNRWSGGNKDHFPCAERTHLFRFLPTEGILNQLGWRTN